MLAVVADPAALQVSGGIKTTARRFYIYIYIYIGVLLYRGSRYIGIPIGEAPVWGSPTWGCRVKARLYILEFIRGRCMHGNPGIEGPHI